MMTKSMTELFLESIVSSLMEEVCLYLPPSPEIDVLLSVFPNSATTSSKSSFQNGFKCVEG